MWREEGHGKEDGYKAVDTVGSRSWGPASRVIPLEGKEAAFLVIACFHPSLAESSGQGHFQLLKGITFAVQCCSYIQERWVPREHATNHFPVQTPLKQFNSLISFPCGLSRDIPSPPLFFFVFISALLGLTTYGLNCCKFSSVAIISTWSSFLTTKFYTTDSAIVICVFVSLHLPRVTIMY